MEEGRGYQAMAGIIVSASKGVIDPLLDKLTEMIENNCANLLGAPSDIVFLRDELRSMNALLEKLEDMEELDPLVKTWRDQVREMAYDIEDCIDDFLHRTGSGDVNDGFFNKVSHFVKTLRGRIETAKHIKELKTRLMEINERCKRYRLGNCVPSSSYVTADRRLPALYNDTTNLVGIEGPREEVIKLLLDMDRQLKVISIVGFGGLGKTTLAKEVYRKVGGQFSTKAFVSVSQRPDIIRILNGIQLKLGIRISSPTIEAKDIIDSIRGYLQHNRYFIVVDDLWDKSTWDIIHSTFPENSLGCRVIVTTRVEDVASWACCNHRQFIYRLMPLKDKDSRRLFFNKIFGCEDNCPSQLKEVATEILKKCGGLPLAVITVASLLATRPATLRKEWESIRNSIGTQRSGTKTTWEGMRQILYLSYKDLPHHLRTCFLYLGIYPEDYIIDRNDLIRQWIAEGFVHYLDGQDLEDVAKSYFNELINRSLIQPMRTEYGEVLSCRVHDMMLDLILRKCAEDNFINTAYNLEEMAGPRDYRVHRLLLDLRVGGAGDATISGRTAPSLSQVRSLQVCGRSPLSVLLLSKYLRVLILDLGNTGIECNGRVFDLTVIRQLFQLRYLKVLGGSHEVKIELPSEIQGLRYLATLQIFCINKISLPSDIVRLPRLSHLIVPDYTMLPNGIGSMKSLCTLRRFDTTDMRNIKDLGQLTNLRDLVICIRSSLTASGIDALVTSLGKLRNLRCLCIPLITDRCYDENDRLGSLASPPLHIERLDLGGWTLARVPRWINGDLKNLYCLDLNVNRTSTDEVRVLGELPSLIALDLDVQCCPLDSDAIVFDPAGFPVLDHLNISCGGDMMSKLRFKAGAMPNLRTLSLSFHEIGWRGTAPVGMEHLLNLQSITVIMFYCTTNMDEAMHDRTWHAFTEAIQPHISRPALHLYPLRTPRQWYRGGPALF